MSQAITAIKEALAPTSTPCEVQDEPSQYGSPEMQALILAKLQPVEGLFINLIAQHEGLAEEMAQDELCSSQEPVAWQYREANDDGTWRAWSGCDKRLAEDHWRQVRALYTAPPKRPWVGLMEDEILDVFKEKNAMKFARNIEAALRSKNT